MEMLKCPQCGTEVASALLNCPSCRWLVHGSRLKDLADEAEAAERDHRMADALAAWRQALELLPQDSRQFQSILEKAKTLSQQLDTASAQAQKAKRSHVPSVLTGLGVVGLLLWNFKFLLVALLAKGKLLLLGFSKIGTLLSMLVSFGVYWTAWGWKFALGLILSIYIHEMGHVAALQRYGIKATAPMFIPGVGALVRLEQPLLNPREDAVVGLAGPLWGLGAAAVALGAYRLFGWSNWAAIARVGGWVTLFNLLPVWQLDGSRGFRALSRSQRWMVVAAIGALWVMTREGLLVLLAIVAAYRAMERQAPATPDLAIFMRYILILIAASWLCLVPVPLPGEVQPQVG